MREFFSKVEKYKRKVGDLIEESLILDTNPLNEEEGNKLLKFFELSKTKKLSEILYLLKKVLPESFLEKNNLNKFIYNVEELPFSPESFSFEGLKDIGGVAKVYLLKSLDENLPSYALKIIKESSEQLISEGNEEVSNNFKEEYEEIKSWYSGDALKVFLPEYVLRFKNPKGKRVAVGILQPYETGEIRDLFNEINKDELTELLKNNNELKEVFISFVSQTLERANKTEEVLDFLGNKNLSIIGQEDEAKLRVLDPHVIYKVSGKGNERSKRSAEYLEYLKEIREKIV
jgi:hypothetical protein